MDHFIWEGYFPGSGYAFATGQQGLSSQQKLQILAGKEVTGPLSKLVVTELTDGELPDLLESSWSAKMVSAKLKRVLDKHCPECIQYIPVKLEDYPDSKYWIANVVTNVSCLDRDKSKITTFQTRPQAIKTIKKLVLKPIEDDAPQVFHMQELPPVLLLSDVLRQALQAASESAGEFVRSDKYRRP